MVLAHTNAAVEELAKRTSDLRYLVKITTLDALSLQLISPYAEAFNLPVPIRPGDGSGRVPYARLSLHAAELLRRCPIVACMLAAMYPIIILDEHQDASENQHAIAMALRSAGSLVRAFGDPMQAIFGEDTISWDDVCSDADQCAELAIAHRWRDDPALGEWILRARESLKRGLPLPLNDAPSAVRVTIVPGGDIRYGTGNVRDYSRMILAFPQQCAALLTARKINIDTLRRASSNRATVYEGSALEHLYDAFDRIIDKIGSPRDLALIVLDLIADTSTGLTAAHRSRIERSLGELRLDPGRQHVVAPLLAVLRKLYDRPSLPGVAQVARELRANCPQFLRFYRPAAFQILSALTSVGAEPYDQLQEAVSIHKAVTHRPLFAVGTVHRTKGIEYDHVLVFNVSETHFPNDVYGRRLLYIAISRCRKSLNIMIPERGRSPLVS